jgi:hypothetical protein
VTDLVVFAGPVVLKPAFHAIPWQTEVQLAVIEGSGSSHFSALGAQLRDGSGRVLPALLRRYAGAERRDFDKVALAAYSAGWGLLNQVFKQEADRREVQACIASDAAFGSGLDGYAAYAADAIRGAALMVGTSSNQSANWAQGIYRTARETWQEIIDNARAGAGCYCLPRQVAARSPLPEPSGGAWQIGTSLFWYDYVAAGAAANTGNDFTHAQHHDLAAAAWTAYLVPLFAGLPWQMFVGGLAAAAGLYWAYRTSRRKA